MTESGGRPAVLVIVRHDSRILLARHRYHATDLPVLIAGMIEEGETAEEAAVREVSEETGLDVTLSGILGTYRYRDDQRTLLMIAVLATSRSTEIQLDNELTHAAWYELDELPPWPADWPIHAVFDDYRRSTSADP